MVYFKDTAAKERCSYTGNMPLLPLGALTFVTFISFSLSSILHQNPPAGRNGAPGEGDGTVESPGFVLSVFH